VEGGQQCSFRSGTIQNPKDPETSSVSPGCPFSMSPSPTHNTLTSLAMLPSEVFWTEALGALRQVHTRPFFVARVVFAAVV
jgi:hypothetical protein